ncbi:MAG: tRNA cyclic N6-threonylcarbamoyladenosine(37) synthase TcdA [Gammaproteobacteria bacterium]|nr:tRNA cyclic N6-threonylcarbamoyladenosine(37) synthase TcdA [Gammaproteobacteria bacterium]
MVSMNSGPTEYYQSQFGGIARLYGEAGAEKIRQAHVCVVGVGGVGSWSVEALARSGVCKITFIDHDDIAASNMNRQLHTLHSTIGRSKVAVLAERVAEINAECLVNPVEDLLTLENMAQQITGEFDVVIDAIDIIKFKAALIHHCSRNKIPVVTTGGAGGMIDPTKIAVTDLSRTTNDPLAAKVRSQLRRLHGFSKNPKRKFGIECVYSTEQPRYPKADGTVCHQKPGVSGLSLDCALGYGAATHITATFGFVAAARAIEKIIKD